MFAKNTQHFVDGSDTKHKNKVLVILHISNIIECGLAIQNNLWKSESS